MRPSSRLLALVLVFSSVCSICLGQTRSSSPRVASPATARKNVGSSVATRPSSSFGTDKFAEQQAILNEKCSNAASDEQISTLKRAAADGDSDAMYCLGSTAFSRGDMNSARSWYEQSAGAGNVFAYLKVATIQLRENPAAARARLKELAGKGLPAAELAYARTLLDGIGGPIDISDAGRAMLIKAAHDGDVEAMEVIGASYLHLAEYIGIFELDPAQAQLYLESAVKHGSDKARKYLHQAYKAGLLKDSAPKPQLDSPDFIAYLHELEPAERIEVLKQQIGKYPANPQRQRAMEELAWLTNGNDPTLIEMLAAKADPNADLVRLKREVAAYTGEASVDPNMSPAASVKDVVERYRRATNIDLLLNHGSVKVKRTTLSGSGAKEEAYCTADGLHSRGEYHNSDSTWESIIYRNGSFTTYFSNQGITKSGQADTSKPTLFDSCLLNFSDAYKWPEQFTFAGETHFNGQPAYELKLGPGNAEYFDTKTGLLIGFTGRDGMVVLGGHRRIGGALFPTARITYGVNEGSLITVDEITLDAPVGQEIFDPSSQNKPILSTLMMSQHGAAPGEDALQELERTAEKLRPVLRDGIALGLDSSEFESRRAAAEHAINAAGDLRRITTAAVRDLYTKFAETARAERRRNPKTPHDVYLNWREATNLDALKKHRSFKVTTKSAATGLNTYLETCEATTQGQVRTDSSAGVSIVTPTISSWRADYNKKKVDTSNLSPEQGEAQRTTGMLRCLPGMSTLDFPPVGYQREEWGVTGATLAFDQSVFGGRNAYRVRVRFSYKTNIPPSEEDYFFDKETSLLLGTYTEDKRPRKEAYSDFRLVEGAVLPFHRYMQVGDSEYQDQIQKIEFDSVPDSEFDVASLPTTQNHSVKLAEKTPDRNSNSSGGGFLNSLNNILQGVNQQMQAQQAGGGDPITQALNQQMGQMEQARQQAAMRDEMRRQEQERQREAERQRQADEERRREARQDVAQQRCLACTSAPDVARYDAECKSAGGGAQAPCYRAAAALCSCQIAAGGCGSSVSSLQQCVSDNNGLADYLRSNAPTFGRGGSSSSGGNGANDEPQKFEWVSQRCAKHWGNAAETACMHFETREKCEGYKGQPCVRDTSKIPPGAAVPAITDQY